MAKKKTDVGKHVLVPKHSKLSEKETKELLARYGITLAELPKIKKKDAAIKSLSCKQDDVIKVTRDSPTAGVAYFYRVVVNA